MVGVAVAPGRFVHARQCMQGVPGLDRHYRRSLLARHVPFLVLGLVLGGLNRHVLVRAHVHGLRHGLCRLA